MTSLIKKLKHSKTLTIMGMGKDGHIASIFPQSIKFKKMIDIKKKPNIVFTDKAGDPFCKRLTMNLSMILLSNKIIVVLKDKNRIKFFLKYLKEENKKTPIYHLAKKAKSKLAFFFNKEIISIKELEKRLV